MQMCGGVEVQLHIHNFCTRCRRVVRFTPWSLYPQRKGPQYPLEGELGSPELVWWQRDKSLLLPGIKCWSSRLQTSYWADWAITSHPRLKEAMKILFMYMHTLHHLNKLRVRFYNSALKMEAVWSSKTLVWTYKFTWYYDSKDQHQHLHHRENLLSSLWVNSTILYCMAKV
jgi:hypothetical protein